MQLELQRVRRIGDSITEEIRQVRPGPGRVRKRHIIGEVDDRRRGGNLLGHNGVDDVVGAGDVHVHVPLPIETAQGGGPNVRQRKIRLHQNHLVVCGRTAARRQIIGRHGQAVRLHRHRGAAAAQV